MSREGDRQRFEYFMANLSHPEASYRWGAAQGLGRLRDIRALDPLLDALHDEDWRVRFKAAWALGELGDRRALPALRRLSRDPSETVRDSAEKAAERILMRL
jgi:HEAT repeat protein